MKGLKLHKNAKDMKEDSIDTLLTQEQVEAQDITMLWKILTVPRYER